MSFDTLQKSKTLRKILWFVGLWTEDDKGALPAMVKSLLIHVPLSFTYTILMWMDVYFSADLNQATDVLYVALTETALVVKIISILYHRNIARQMFEEWRSSEQFRLHSVQEKWMWRQSFRTFGIVSFLYITCSFSVVVYAFAAVLFLNTYQLPFPYWTPFNWNQPIYYWYAYFYGALATPLTCISNITLDMWQCYIMLHLAVCYKLIAMRLQQLNGNPKEANRNVTKDIIRIVQFEQKVKRMSKQCESIVSYPVLAQILLSALVLCFSLYRLQNVNFFDDPGKFAYLVQYAVCMTFQIFLPCYYANKLTVESLRLMDSAYNCNWMEMALPDRRIILLYMQYLNRPVVLRTGKFFDIGLPVYTKTMNNAYSFFALLLNMDM
ncbi:odorant receptor 94a-like [Musca vetustissima]|uniref:odorant receptor 94a-like n=1 Tax=Musca vetustissima TaxID=27455 RepID=UPI002AB660BF|nr:odorant receptor 94a-like [Musca vetustissima]